MKHRRGITTTELVCASMVISIVAVTLLPIVRIVSRQHQLATQHLEADNALGNVMDDVAALPYKDVNNNALAAIEVPEWLEKQLTDAQLAVTVSNNHDGKQVTAVLTWQGVNGGIREKTRLHLWVFPGEGT